MCGPHDSVLGREVEPVIDSFLDGMKRRFPVAEDNVRLNGCLVALDEANFQATDIQRIDLAKSWE